MKSITASPYKMPADVLADVLSPFIQERIARNAAKHAYPLGAEAKTSHDWQSSHAAGIAGLAGHEFSMVIYRPGADGKIAVRPTAWAD